MLYLRPFSSGRLSTTCGLLPPAAAVFPSPTPKTSNFNSVGQIRATCRPVTANHNQSWMPQRSPLLTEFPQAHCAQRTTPKSLYHRFGLSQYATLPSRLAPSKNSNSFSNLVLNQSSIRRCLIQKPPIRKSHATVHDAITFFSQPLEPSCRRQSLRRGFSISLPILIIYLLLYLLSLTLQKTELSQYYIDTVNRFWAYRRHEGVQSVASLCTYVTSQFTHARLVPLVIDSLVLVGVASILGSVFNRRIFFAVYVLGGFLAAAADCVWAQLTNPCRSLTQAQLNDTLTSVRMVDEATAKLTAISHEVWTKISFENPQENPQALVKASDEMKRQREIIDKPYPFVRDWYKWNRPNWAASGSLVSISMLPARSVSTLFYFSINRHLSDADFFFKKKTETIETQIRPLTNIKYIRVRRGLVLYKLTACFCILSLYENSVSNTR